MNLIFELKEVSVIIALIIESNGGKQLIVFPTTTRSH